MRQRVTRSLPHLKNSDDRALRTIADGDSCFWRVHCQAHAVPSHHLTSVNLLSKHYFIKSIVFVHPFIYDRSGLARRKQSPKRSMGQRVNLPECRASFEKGVHGWMDSGSIA